MSQELMHSVVAIATAIVGLAAFAVIVSKNANTANVIQAGSSGFSNAVAVAISPVTGSSYNVNLSYPNNDTIGE